MSALPERLRNGTRKLAPTCTGTLLPYSGSFFFSEQIHRLGLNPYVWGKTQ